MVILSSLCAFTACSDKEDAAMDDSLKTPVALSVGVEAPAKSVTRAVITDEVGGKTFSAFGSATDIWMLMQSDFVPLSGNSSALDEKDFKGSQAIQYCSTLATTGEADGTVSKLTFNPVRYWDDAHSRSSALSVWAVAVPGVTGGANAKIVAPWNGKAAWSGTSPANKQLAWSISAAQNTSTMAAEDLCFSNNIANYIPTSGTDRRLKYKMVNSEFDKTGKLVFYHALSKITVKVVEGAGFDVTSLSDFNFDVKTSEQDVAGAVPFTMKGFSLGGTFDVATGEFNSVNSTTTITSLHNAGKTAEGYTLEALVMPGTNLSTLSLDDAMAFSLDGNAFKVSSATLLAKVREGISNDSWTTIEAGKNYVFTLRINKTAIKVSATVKDWEVLNAAPDAPIIKVTDSYGVEANATTLKAFTSDFSFLRSTSINSNYADEADAVYSSGYTLSPALYWPDHNTHYFFRGIWPLIDDAAGHVPVASFVGKNAISVANCTYSADTYPSDLMLGYPRTAAAAPTGGADNKHCTAHNLDVSLNGICATEGEIRMNFQRAMTRVTVKLVSSEEGAKDRVEFNEHTIIEIVDGYTSGKINLADGSSDFTDVSKTAWTMPLVGTDYANRSCAVVPQSLGTDGALDNLKFRITVGDGVTQDKYETVLGIRNIKVGGNYITDWEPGKHYQYTLTITKTGIVIKATLKDWDEVKGSEEIWM